MYKRFIKLPCISISMMLMMISAPAFAYEEKRVPGSIADIPGGWDHLFKEMLIDITVIGVIFSLITIYLLIRYRRKYKGQNGKPPKLSTPAAIAWALIPVFIFLADDFYLAAEGWSLWNDIRRVPENAYEVKVDARMWSWRFTYPDGVETLNELRVPVGTPVVVRMTSEDVIHSFFIPDFRVKEDVMPGRVTYVWFYPKSAGEYLITCAEYCGVMHSGMKGMIIAMPKDEFNKWFETEKKNAIAANAEGGA